MITVLHSESSMGWGGQERRIMRELLGLRRDTFRPLLACRPGSKIGAMAAAQGIRVEFIKMRGNFDPRAVFKLMAVFRRQDVDIVHTHSAADSWMASAAAKLCSRRPAVVRTRHISCTFNNRAIYNVMADRVITVGESTRRYMIEEKGIHGRKVLTIPTGVDLTHFDPDRVVEDLRSEFGIPAGAPVLGTVAVFRFMKGHRYLLKATQEILRVFPEAKLLLVGEGPQEHNLRPLIAEYGISSSVIMPGFREDVPRVLNTLDVFVFPSLQEALGTAVLEAMAMRRAVIASRVGGIPEVVEDGRTGYLIDPENPGAIAEKVIRLFGDSALRREMGTQGRRFVEKNYDNRFMIERIEKLYQELMEKRRT